MIRVWTSMGDKRKNQHNLVISLDVVLKEMAEHRGYMISMLHVLKIRVAE